jgi:hypothetical protein
MTEEKKAAGENSSKPEWFQLIDSDAPSAQVSKINKKLPVIALIVTGVIAVSGTFFASASDSNPLVSTTAVSDVVDTNNRSEIAPSATPVESNSTVNVSSPVTPENGLQNPAQGGVAAPRGDHEDDDDDDHWGWLPGHDDDDEDHDDEDHERRERH